MEHSKKTSKREKEKKKVETQIKFCFSTAQTTYRLDAYHNTHKVHYLFVCLPLELLDSRKYCFAGLQFIHKYTI